MSSPVTACSISKVHCTEDLHLHVMYIVHVSESTSTKNNITLTDHQQLFQDLHGCSEKTIFTKRYTKYFVFQCSRDIKYFVYSTKYFHKSSHYKLDTKLRINYMQIILFCVTRLGDLFFITKTIHPVIGITKFSINL